ncbi:hypothetical protein [Phocaeicola barnesiae]|uniref:Major fimbrial subunit protein N-terminal domain-containing protein n=1 Tax=Phocaeicola barnesiae TaxID=376804 RepID=A0AAW5N2F9_9BACT|nr:hypothetical protein [Phocaeicola barnesiae]MCR8875091.1 hypothetical protein [Phocaeicola barnesiae]
MMKKQYMLFMPAAFCLTLLACTDENLTGNGMTNPDEQPTGETGKVVVDYTLDADAPASRADGSATDSPETSSSSPIRSLTYLLYEKTGTDEVDNAVYTLVKRREIRDITEETQWPMTRENMTWNQREDLKDTLDRASVYKVVFVANADASLHKGEQVLFNASLDVKTPEGEEPQEPLLNFTDAYLRMPQEAFTDDNLFYVTTADFKSSKDADYVNQSLNLERVVARTELSCIANVPGSKAVEARLETYFYPRIKGSDVSSVDETIMAQICNNYKTSVTLLLADEQKLCGEYADYIIPAPEGEESVTCKSKLKDLLESFQNRPQEFEPAVQVEVLKQLTENLMSTENDNSSFSKQYAWENASEVRITFSSCTDKVGLDGTYRKAEETDPITWTVPVENGRINLTTFGTDDTGDASVKQEITSLAFYSQSTEGTGERLFTVTCQNAHPLVLDLAANWRICLELDPAVQILPKVRWYSANTVDVTATVDLEKILKLSTEFEAMQPPQGGDTAQGGDAGTNYYEEFKKHINTVISNVGLGDINNFKITVKIPNTSNPETYTCVPGWREVVNTASGNE